jgi:protein-tyrosine phosphatase
MLRAVEALLQAFEREGVALSLHQGAELDVDRMQSLDEDELGRLTLAGGGRYLLVETPYHGWSARIVEQLLRPRTSGFVPVLAHPERNAAVQETPSVLEPLVRGGTLAQVTAASLDGRLGARPRKAALRLVADGLAHLVASDAHTPDIRAAGMRSALETVGDEKLGAWLVEDVPLAVLEDRPRAAEAPAQLART